jgi:hypothetical protein
LEKLKSLLDRILIIDQLDQMHIESQKLLRNEKIEGKIHLKIFILIFFVHIDLRILFELVNRVKNGNESIQKDLENYAYDSGMDAIDRNSTVAIEVNYILILINFIYFIFYSIRIRKSMSKRLLKFVKNFQKLLKKDLLVNLVIWLHLIK